LNGSSLMRVNDTLPEGSEQLQDCCTHLLSTRSRELAQAGQRVPWSLDTSSGRNTGARRRRAGRDKETCLKKHYEEQFGVRRLVAAFDLSTAVMKKK
jgi:hypothetical protein